MVREYTMVSPLFGKCVLIRQAQPPASPVTLGYVELEGSLDRLVIAIFDRGQWKTRNLKPFPKPVASWFKMVKADGSEVF